jgi:hypothetical protein
LYSLLFLSLFPHFFCSTNQPGKLHSDKRKKKEKKKKEKEERREREKGC